jgi:surfactin synthase thioesterase subunit
MIEALANDLPEGTPCIFMGHCFGGVVALELARELRRRGRKGPERLLVAGEPPQVLLRDGPIRDVKEEVRRTNAMDEATLADDRIFALLEPTLAADFNLINAYRYECEPALDVPIEVFVAEGDSTWSQSYAALWAEHGSHVRISGLPGPHLYPGSPAWTGLIGDVLGRVAEMSRGKRE